MLRFALPQLQMAAFSRIAAELAGCLLRRKMNGSFQECGHAALLEVDRPQRAENHPDQLPVDGLASCTFPALACRQDLAGTSCCASRCSSPLRAAHSRTASRKYLRYAMLLRTTPMPYSARYRSPNAAIRFSVMHWNCGVASSPQALQPTGRIWHGNGKPQRRRFDWSPRPATKPSHGWRKQRSRTLASSTSSASSHGRLRAILSNRRRPGSRATASPIREALA